MKDGVWVITAIPAVRRGNALGSSRSTARHWYSSQPQDHDGWWTPQQIYPVAIGLCSKVVVR